MNTRLFRSFSMELMKLASDIPDDAALRQALAEREGDEDYLPGGELVSNAPESVLQKVAISSLIAAQLGTASPLRKKTRKKGPHKYQEGRDWAITGLKGATGGVGVTGLVHSLRNAEHKLTTKQVRTGAGVGTGIALADRILRHYADSKSKKKTAGIVSPSPERAVKTPGAILRAGQQTGAMKARAPMMAGKAFGPVRLGTKKFQMPTRLGVR